GSVNVFVPAESHLPPQVSWDFQIDVEDGELRTPTPVEHIFGGVRLAGRQSAEGAFARGDLNIDSVMIRGMQFTNLEGPFWLDGQRLVFGSLADRGTADIAGQRRPPRQITARVMAGLLSLYGELALAGN